MNNWEKYYGSPSKVAKLLYGKPCNPVHAKFIQWLNDGNETDESREVLFRKWLQEEAS